ncbi:hypothetical protein GGTG_02777 [Gaeumannomyces tritici R3-111a-1]|uniref:Uncharacterized protein n=1 Tax=Gaeumannomyces tritici (strain R3-111a-1) TaxID=644352 RepID=J3NNC1_GAET3|nr:hypothetical protein GGTG_02777 [Gaeumannomyces tritici R3-111a-1]EJT77673.1 hypothetical protein GGTG_02777 [Gaeumannomyces tritici R3-111a-1]
MSQPAFLSRHAFEVIRTESDVYFKPAPRRCCPRRSSRLSPPSPPSPPSSPLVTVGLGHGRDGAVCWPAQRLLSEIGRRPLVLGSRRCGVVYSKRLGQESKGSPGHPHPSVPRSPIGPSPSLQSGADVYVFNILCAYISSGVVGVREVDHARHVVCSVLYAAGRNERLVDKPQYLASRPPALSKRCCLLLTGCRPNSTRRREGPQPFLPTPHPLGTIPVTLGEVAQEHVQVSACQWPLVVRAQKHKRRRRAANLVHSDPHLGSLSWSPEVSGACCLL